MADDLELTQEMRDAIGTVSPPHTRAVDASSIRTYARAVGHADLVFYDEAVAKQRGYRSLLAPPGYLGTRNYSPLDDTATGVPGYAGTLTRLLNGGTAIEHLRDVCAGDVLTAQTRIVEISLKRGSAGPLLLTTSETEYRNQDGELVAVTRGTLINY